MGSAFKCAERFGSPSPLWWEQFRDGVHEPDVFARERLHCELEEWHVDAGPVGFYTDRAVATHNNAVTVVSHSGVLGFRIPVMAAGSRGRYALNLDSIMAFPDADHIPVLPPYDGESWYFLLEVSSRSQGRFASIVEMRSSKRKITKVSSGPGVEAQDKIRTGWTVFLDTLNAQTDPRGFARGHTVCIKNLRPTQVIGDRLATIIYIDDPNAIEVWGVLSFLTSD
jgi:hypothetical protein